ncbi:MAG: Flp pilus assembly complex ATPase component TadA [Kiritimatiellae bacterium]|nr:Flp pilus assembly complex ATPase component TadA [Kiritimatiellia bacterium]MBQ9344649.1 Flp pilus assembly complex ATPase component TadA [Kiritimatiellia bacterium]
MSEQVTNDLFLDEAIRAGVLDPSLVQDILDEHERTSKPTRTVAVELGALTEDQAVQVIGDFLAAERVDLDHMTISADVLAAIPGNVARMYNICPIAADSSSVTVAVCDMMTPATIDEISFVLSKDVLLAVATADEVVAAITRYYGAEDESMKDVIADMEADLEGAGDLMESGAKMEDLASVEAAANSRPVVRFVNLVLYQAVQDRASDIHFEPFEDQFKIRYRVDGALYEMAPPPKNLALPIISRLKVISGLNIAERRVPQDGRIQLPISGRMIDFRVSTLPTQFGESVVLRVLDRSVVSLDLENIGMPDDIYHDFCEDIDKPNGIVVVTGPTGSGKTTTLYSALRRLNTIENKLLTAEEPVEYDIDGIVQVPINEAIGVTFGKVLRAFLRQDPDIIMVGEIRDLETAEIAIQASLTGHLVFSTLHTNDAAGAVTRLIDMNVEPFLIASTLEAVLGQRLVRTICNNCKTPYTPTPEILQQLGLTEKQVGGRPFYYGAGCSYCNQTGYKGRRGIYEYLRVKDPIRDLINQRKPTLVIRDKAVEMGMRTLREDGIRCILDGYTTVEEVLKYT